MTTQTKASKNTRLVMYRQNRFFGVIGEPTGVYCGDVELCIGDSVRVGAGVGYNPSTGIIGVFNPAYISVMGYGRPLSQLNIEEILFSHQDYTVGSHGYISVAEQIV